MIRKIVLAFLIIPLIIIFVFTSLLVFYPIMNNIALSTFEKQFFDHPLPPHTKVLEIGSTVGKLNGNGNGLDFFACYLIESPLSVTELTDYYDKTEFKTAKKGKFPVVTEVLETSSYIVESKYLEHDTLQATTLTG